MDKIYISPVARSVPFDNSDTGFESENVRDAIVESYDTLESRINFPLTFGQQGLVTDSYIQGFFNISSDESPTYLPFECELITVSFGNENEVGSANVYIYEVDENVENQNLLYTLVVNGRSSYSPILSGIYIPQGHGTQVRIESLTNPKPSSPIVLILLRKTV